MSCSKTLDLSPAVSGAHLSYYWTMNEAGDAIKLDSTAFQPWNTVVGSASPPALFSNGLELDCTAFNHGVSGPDSPAFAFNEVSSDGISFWFWYKLLVAPTPGDGTFTNFFMEQQATVPPDDSSISFVLSANPGTAPAYLMYLQHNDYTLGNFAQAGPITFNPTIGVWHMICGTLDLVAQTLNIYVDSALVSTTADPFNYNTSDKGVLTLQNNTFGPHPLDVLIDEFGLSLKGALTQAQITALWNSGAGVTWPNITAIVPYP